MIVTYAFVLLLTVPSWGGEGRTTSEWPTLEGCRAARRAVWTQLETSGTRYTLTECERVVKPERVPTPTILER